MAEAHSAVAFHFSISSEGIIFNMNRDALRPVIISFLRNVKRSTIRLRQRLLNKLYPLTPAFCIAIVAVIWGLHIAFGDWTGLADPVMAFTSKILPPPLDLFATLILLVVVGVTILIYLHKYIVKILLLRHAWMYEPLGRPSTTTKLQISLLRLLLRKNAQLSSLQAFLPSLPLPCVKDTIQRYLRSVQPLMTEAQYNRIEALAAQFQNGQARKLQCYLHLKRLLSVNYVSDWWEEYVYLYGRSPIMVNSNYYGLEMILRDPPTHCQAARAAMCTYCICKLRENVRAGDHKPVMIQNAIPLCTWQYERLLNTFRIPGEEKDTVVHRDYSDHVTVYCRGRIYCVKISDGNRLYSPVELEEAFQFILDADVSDVTEAERRLPALTAGERAPWARARSRFFSSGVNRASLHTIETSMLFIALDDRPYGYDPNDPSKLNEYAKAILHGDCHSRWFDTETLIIASNGRQGCNMEHSFADAPVPRECWERTVVLEAMLGYASDGHCKGSVERHVPQPARLKWEFTNELSRVIDSQLEIAQTLANDVDMHLFLLPFGKAVAKRHRVSPDAFIQMTLQLAYFRDQNKFCLTYESSMTRLFREGRTETVRSCTADSVAFVRALDDEKKSREEKVASFRKACETHQNLYRDAMTGKGIDRHLFTMYVVSRYIGVDTPFLKEVLSEPWRLSTSQSPYCHLDPEKLKEIDPDSTLFGIGGGFGPVSDDGYGVAYMIVGENMIAFHISSKVSCPATLSKRFAQNITKAFSDINALCTND